MVAIGSPFQIYAYPGDDHRSDLNPWDEALLSLKQPLSHVGGMVAKDLRLLFRLSGSRRECWCAAIGPQISKQLSSSTAALTHAAVTVAVYDRSESLS